MADIENEKNIENEQTEERADEQAEQAGNQQQEEAPETSEKASHEKKPWSRKAKMLALAAVLASVAALIAGVNLTMTAFSANSHMKAVAATNESPNLLSSDVLAGYSEQPKVDDYPLKSTVVPISNGTASFSFSIFNYLQNDPTLYCQKNIEYTLNIQVTGGEANASHGIQVNGGGPQPFGTSCKIEGQVLNGRTKSENAYTITLPESEVNKAIFVITATVSDSGGTTVRYLVAKVAPSQEATVATSDVTVEPVQDNGTDIKNYDAYRYQVKVSGATAAVKISWNSDLIEIDPYFAGRYNATVRSNTVSFTSDPGITFITFYRVSDSAPKSWDDLGVEKVS